MRWRALTRTLTRACWGAAWLWSGCGSPGAARGTESAREQRSSWEAQCLRFVVRREGPYHLPLADPLDAPVLDAVPAEARRIARAAGLEPLLAALLEERTPGALPSLRLLALRQELSLRLATFEAQLTSILSEVECTDDFLEQVGAELAERERTRELALTVSSLVIGAGAATASGIWQLVDGDSKGAIAVGVGGGTASAGLGLAALIPREQVTVLAHEHNLLEPITRAEDPEHLYPTAVFRLLSLPRASEGKSVREELQQIFERELARALSSSEARRHAAELLYGSGGTYDQELVGLRERLYDELESKLAALARELELLTRFLVKLLDDERGPQFDAPQPVR